MEFCFHWDPKAAQSARRWSDGQPGSHLVLQPLLLCRSGGSCGRPDLHNPSVGEEGLFYPYGRIGKYTNHLKIPWSLSLPWPNRLKGSHTPLEEVKGLLYKGPP